MDYSLGIHRGDKTDYKTNHKHVLIQHRNIAKYMYPQVFWSSYSIIRKIHPYYVQWMEICIESCSPTFMLLRNDIVTQGRILYFVLTILYSSNDLADLFWGGKSVLINGTFHEMRWNFNKRSHLMSPTHAQWLKGMKEGLWEMRPVFPAK